MIFFLLLQVVFAYNETVSRQSAYLSHLTYCDNYSCDNCIVDYIVENEGSFAIQGYDSISDSIFTAFRGSSNMHNWVENMQISHVSPYENASLLVEKGFYKDYSFIKDALFENLEVLTEQYQTSNLLITGHSLGSSACTLFAYDVFTMKNYEIAHFYNFGSPRVGNDAFVEDFNEKIVGFRVVHANDIVASVPPILFDYAHISFGICYDENNTKYDFCDDSSCGMSCSSDDHLNYLNVTMGSSGC
jgi:hypothetical protein